MADPPRGASVCVGIKADVGPGRGACEDHRACGVSGAPTAKRRIAGWVLCVRVVDARAAARKRRPSPSRCTALIIGGALPGFPQTIKRMEAPPCYRTVPPCDRVSLT